MLTGQWLDEDFNYKSAMLNARHFPGRHTVGLIESNFNIMLGEWSIDNSRIQMLVRDGVSNIALGARLSELDSIHCFIHQLQLCIESSILSQRSVNDMCAKARKIVTHFHHSNQAYTIFKNIQIENGSKQPLLLVQDVKTHWNSTFLMLQQLSILKAIVQLYAGDNEIPILTANEWQLMDNVLCLLQTFFEITKKVSGEQSILSAVIPDVAALDRFLTKYTTKDSGVHTLKEELQQELNRRFFSPNQQDIDVKYSKQYVVGTLLDRRFKGNFMSVKSLSNGRVMLMHRWLDNARDPHSRLSRWSLTLQTYPFQIKDRSGKRHSNANALSRIPPSAECKDIKNNDIYVSAVDVPGLQLD